MPCLSDASIFELEAQEIILPQTQSDLLFTVKKALLQQRPLTLRAGGTSLGGQSIGSGVIVDVSKHLNNIFDYAPKQQEVVVEPGVIQDDLNDFVAMDGLRFAPDTSTSNRAMIGGMIGNNSCGSYSVWYGTTREHVKSVEVILSDGSEAIFSDLSSKALQQKLQQQTLEGQIYRFVMDLLHKGGEKILAAFPHPSIKRRNTGYALDELYRHHQPFNPTGKPFNLTTLICGSEGTLAVIKRATLRLVKVASYRKLICAHYHSVESALEQVSELLTFSPAAIELIDQVTLACTQDNLQHQKNRFWIQDTPGAVLVIELFDDDAMLLNTRIEEVAQWLLSQKEPNNAYAAPVIEETDASKIWAIRKAGLGLLMGKVTRQKAVAVIEDAAIPVDQMPNYYRDVRALMAELNVGCVYYGHASVGLIHVRPELDLATDKGRKTFQIIAQRISTLVKLYRGALSGEHGDGRIRAPFLPEQFGEEVYGYLVALKQTFDPDNLLNPDVIIGKHSITKNLRADRQIQKTLKTGFDWSADLSLMDAVEKCNGAGACRKSVGRGVMCPSYQATREENYSTRGRSNLLRFALTELDPIQALSSDELQTALTLCLGCKACKNECPASVDMAKLKSEVLYQTGGKPQKMQRWALKHYDKLLAVGAKWPAVFNYVQNTKMVKRLMGVDERCDLPEIKAFDVPKWWANQVNVASPLMTTVWVLCDVFSLKQEPEVAKATLSSLNKLGLTVKPVYLTHSPRALISQGLLDEAKALLLGVISQLKAVASNDWVVGIEPSELLVWRDELATLLDKKTLSEAKWLQQPSPVLSFEELLLNLVKKQKLPEFKKIPPPYISGKVWLHVHCHQKALAKPMDTKMALQLIPKIKVEMIASGCCGMSGEFGYKQYELSKKIAEQGVLPALKNTLEGDLVVATGMSCRHQINRFGQQNALHIAQVFDLVLP
ncbi:Fe-S protein, homolog of lactate dehydrogenase SO1521 [hydrothermal vent metagenome]|uniref:Fe-S protein, homolog of lactate dehydrogenase SO1521 n=1 Tax=hydrothermal vent metagenome TaxID=652676 RepID=A0A3B0X0P1_9ZZZZ